MLECEYSVSKDHVCPILSQLIDISWYMIFQNRKRTGCINFVVSLSRSPSHSLSRTLPIFLSPCPPPFPSLSLSLSPTLPLSASLSSTLPLSLSPSLSLALALSPTPHRPQISHNRGGRGWRVCRVVVEPKLKVFQRPTRGATHHLKDSWLMGCCDPQHYAIYPHITRSQAVCSTI